MDMQKVYTLKQNLESDILKDLKVERRQTYIAIGQFLGIYCKIINVVLMKSKYQNKGTFDILPPETEVWQHVESGTVHRICQQFDFQKFELLQLNQLIYLSEILEMKLMCLKKCLFGKTNQEKKYL